MASQRRITIIGGGLAGLTLGIGLLQNGVPVVIHEAGRYPRHRVCGEFISGRGRAVLARLGLSGLLDRAGAVPARTAAFFSPHKRTPVQPLPEIALCLSRFKLDAALAGEFRRSGGELREGERWRAENLPEGTVLATGRRPVTDRGSNEQESKARWYGLKIHARNVTLSADLEMHLSANGYVGLCRIGGGEVNVCGLFRSHGGPDAAGRRHERLLGAPGSLLFQRLAPARWDEDSFCAVAGLSLSPYPAAAHADICLGDAITMIPPVTGNGMSMAFESADMAIAPLTAWSRGELSWAEMRSGITHACDTAFARRLFWAKHLQRLIFMPAWQAPLLFAAGNAWLWRQAFTRTR